MSDTDTDMWDMWNELPSLLELSDCKWPEYIFALFLYLPLYGFAIVYYVGVTLLMLGFIFGFWGFVAYGLWRLFI